MSKTTASSSGILLRTESDCKRHLLKNEPLQPTRRLEQEEMRWLEMRHRSLLRSSSISSPFECNPKRCNPQPSPRTAMSGKATRRTPHTGPNIVKVSTMEEGSRSDDVMMKPSSGPSPAPWRFRGIARGHGCHGAPWQSRTSQTAAWNRLRHPGRGSRHPMAAFDEPLHAGGPTQNSGAHASDTHIDQRMGKQRDSLIGCPVFTQGDLVVGAARIVLVSHFG